MPAASLAAWPRRAARGRAEVAEHPDPRLGRHPAQRCAASCGRRPTKSAGRSTQRHGLVNTSRAPTPAAPRIRPNGLRSAIGWTTRARRTLGDEAGGAQRMLLPPASSVSMKNDAPGSSARTLAVSRSPRSPMRPRPSVAAWRRMGDLHHRAAQARARRRQAIERGNRLGRLVGRLLDFLRGLLDSAPCCALSSRRRRADTGRIDGVVAPLPSRRRFRQRANGQRVT